MNDAARKAEHELSKVIRLGTVEIDGSPADVFCRVKYDGQRLSITGVEGPTQNGNCRGSCGQITIDADRINPAPGWSATKIQLFAAAWDRWHLNDMRAGTPVQERWLRENPVKYAYPKSHYVKACEALAAAGLNPDPETGYRYGSAWLYEEVPGDVIGFLASLPDTDKAPAWV